MPASVALPSMWSKRHWMSPGEQGGCSGFLRPNRQEHPIMWIRQSELVAQTEARSPIPTRIASNEELIPPPQSPQQIEFENRLTAISEEAARRQGLDRCDFLRSGSGLA